MVDHRPIVITGASGFVGRNLVPRLLSDGLRPRLALRPGTAIPPDWRRLGLEMVEVPDLIAADLRPLLQGAAGIVHLAGLAHVTGAAGRNVEPFTLANVATTRQLTEAARAVGVRRFIFLSSLAAITPNSTETIVNDDTDIAPVTPYGQSKRAAEDLVDALAAAGHEAVSLRPPLVVGADARGNWRSLEALAASGLPLPFACFKAKRSFVSVQTLTEAIARLCRTDWPATHSGKYCLADPEPMTLPAVLAALRAGMRIPPRLFPFPPALIRVTGRLVGRGQQIAGLTGPLRVDSGRFFAAFGFSPSLTLRDAIGLSGEDYLKRRDVS